MKEITEQEFQAAFKEVINQDITIISVFRANKGSKSIRFNPSKAVFKVESSKTEPYMTESIEEAYDAYSSINI